MGIPVRGKGRYIQRACPVMFGRRGQIHIIHDDREAFASRLQRYRFNLNHLTLPEIKDFNALGDRFCFK
jgi:hypothetical protein